MVLEWWNDIVQWFSSTSGRAIITSAILPFAAIVVSGIIASVIARGSIKRLITQRDREHKAAAVAALVAVARRTASWNSLSAADKDRLEYQLSEVEVRIRLLPVAGAGLAADWAAHQLASIKKNSAAFGAQASQDLVDLQDGLIAWQDKPHRARKLFAQDVAAWKYEIPEDELVTRQREWAANQATSTPTTPLVPQKDTAGV